MDTESQKPGSFATALTPEGPVEAALRKKALRRSRLCAGAGLALLGQNSLATSVFVASFSALPALILLALAPSPLTLALLGAAFLTAIWAYFREKNAIALADLRQTKLSEEGWFVRHFWKVAVVAWTCALATLVFFVMSLGSMLVVGNGMRPTLVAGERLIYRRSVNPDALKRGRVVAFRTTSRSAWGKPGDLVVARILATPGDQLSLRFNRYSVNGQPASEAGPLLGQPAVINVPEPPDQLTVPDGRYFVAQDAAGKGYDSRVLSWVETQDLVSTELYYLGARGLLTRVK